MRKGTTVCISAIKKYTWMHKLAEVTETNVIGYMFIIQTFSVVYFSALRSLQRRSAKNL